jgi:hypothetical protein
MWISKLCGNSVFDTWRNSRLFHSGCPTHIPTEMYGGSRLSTPSSLGFALFVSIGWVVCFLGESLLEAERRRLQDDQHVSTLEPEQEAECVPGQCCLLQQACLATISVGILDSKALHAELAAVLLPVSHLWLLKSRRDQ